MKFVRITSEISVNPNFITHITANMSNVSVFVIGRERPIETEDNFRDPDDAKRLKDKLTTGIEQAISSERDLLKRIRGWDMMDVTADGPYWRAEIDKVIG